MTVDLFSLIQIAELSIDSGLSFSVNRGLHMALNMLAQSVEPYNDLMIGLGTIS